MPVRLLQNLDIDKGKLTVRVENEFEASLTVAGDKGPWRLLKVEILVQDRDVGEGRSLVHSLQVGYLQNVLQAHLMQHQGPDGGDQAAVVAAAPALPLHNFYDCLHSFCQSLQLEVVGYLSF